MLTSLPGTINPIPLGSYSIFHPPLQDPAIEPLWFVQIYS